MQKRTVCDELEGHIEQGFYGRRYPVGPLLRENDVPVRWKQRRRHCENKSALQKPNTPLHSFTLFHVRLMKSRGNSSL